MQEFILLLVIMYAIITNFKNINQFDKTRKLCEQLAKEDNMFHFTADEKNMTIKIFDISIEKLNQKARRICGQDYEHTIFYDIVE